MSKKTYAQAFIDAMANEMSRDKDVVLVGEDIQKLGGCFGETKGLYEKFGDERVINMPISESGYVGMCVGMAMMGKRPVAELMFADFGSYAYDSIAVQASKMRFMTGGNFSVPLTIVGNQGAFSGNGETHSQCVEGWFQNIPGLKIVVPSTPDDVSGLLKTAVRDNDPVLFLMHKALFLMKGEVNDDPEYKIPLGKAKVVREGQHVTIIAYQMMLRFAQQAAEDLAKEGIECEIVDPRSLFPLDEKALCASVKKTGRCLIVHEHPLRGGWGGELASVITEKCFADLKKPIARLGQADCSIPFNEQEYYVFPDPAKIKAAVKNLLA